MSVSVCSSSTLPKLRQAKFKSLETKVDYKSGASFKGGIHDHKKCGEGIFSWPNGAQYEGGYMDNLRHGSGIQIWQDGSRYEGDFVEDMRHGRGKLTWSNGESYDGSFFKDRRHGKGEYTWTDGSTYTGTFYMDRKEGHGIFRFANGNTFEGLYKDDERMGPGVLSYSDGKHDAGLWIREKLVKLCSAIDGAFTMEKHKEFDFNPKEHVMYISMEDDEKPNVEEMLQTPEIFDYLPESRLSDRVTDLYSEPLDPRSLTVNRDMFDKEFFPGSDSEKSDRDEKVPAWNKTPSVIKMQRHVHRHKSEQKKLSYDVQKLLKGDRSKFGPKGPLESASEELIQAATCGDIKLVEDLFTAGLVHPDVADKNGHTALIGATVNWHMEVINCLLNHGADVNKLNDEGCSALSAGTIFFYPVEGFHYNIAERYLERPPPVQENKDKKVPVKPKSILNKKQSNAVTKPSQPGIIAKPKPAAANQSHTSVDSGFPQTDSNQSMGSPSKPQVRIMDPSEQAKPVSRPSQEKADSEEPGSAREERPDEVEFESTVTLHDYEIQVSEQLLERCATQLSTNEKVVGGRRSHSSMELGTVRHLAVCKNEKERMKNTMDLLLKRGADPNASSVPMPVLFFAIKSADVEVVKTLLMKGASTAITLPKELKILVNGHDTTKGGLAPLHIAAGIPGEEGVLITELLLNALADPDVRAAEDDSFLNRSLAEEWSKDAIMPESLARLGGRTPLQIACARDDNYKVACRVTRLLLEHKANPNLMCNGFSPIALTIACGNDLALDELILFGADTSLALTHGVGSALCAATSTEYEHRRQINGRLQLIDKLVRAGANILAPIPIGPKRVIGTAVDYAYYMFNQDRRIAHMPYHALTHAERETYNARRKLLAHIGDILRTKAVDRERRRLEDEISLGKRSRSPSPNFVYVGAGADLPSDSRRPKSLRADPGGESKVTFDATTKEGAIMGRGYPERDPGTLPSSTSSGKQRRSRSTKSYFRKTNKTDNIRKPIFKYCYECGRSVGMRLSACTRCKEVYYCSKACKLKAWNARHKEECIRIGGGAFSASMSWTSGRNKSSANIDSWVNETNTGRGGLTQSNGGRGSLTQPNGGRGGLTQTNGGHGGLTQPNGGRGGLTQTNGGRGSLTQPNGGRGGRRRGRSRSPSPMGRKGAADSPTPATDINKGKKTTAAELQKGVKINVPYKGFSRSAGGQFIGTDAMRRMTQSEKGNRRWTSPPPGVIIHNYSYV
ncbi:ankyrin repeat and MYND domain-containing protein 1-like isoform X4 [Mizuhopecten yessoensis]|uniref:ankyrin repeat and MYND domain-containing protein 1-like isoform X4 n=1 Tax=Mizuhopecten yessoensis TaxID=6573 RepID=UPI000B45D385|nr:ankyrin repeat and MYND domain-containing protein 1-like isoform X4 [Mizuhopecten yessoensis]